MKESLYSSNVIDNLKYINSEIEQAAIGAGRNPNEISLMAVTKTVDSDIINISIDNGIRLLGENRVQELLSKYDRYDKFANIHFIGHLQTNKVKDIIDKVSMIHSVDSEKLAKEIDKQAERIGIVMDILIQVNIGNEDTKSGVSANEVANFSEIISQFKNLRLRGLMAIPPVSDSENERKINFSRMQQLLVDINSKKVDNDSVDVLSIGMSNDFRTAIHYGATIIRIGTALYGDREYL